MVSYLHTPLMQSNVKLEPKQKELIMRGAKISGIGITTFFRVCALEKAKKLILEEKGVTL